MTTRLPMQWLRLIVTIAIGLIASNTSWAQSRDLKVRADRDRVVKSKLWYYNDLENGLEEASRTDKPVIVVFRCVPCESCVKLDDDVIEAHPKIQSLLSKFVRVRQISTNGIDLNLFQFDTDQSFCVFFLRGDKTIYGRFGTRSDRTHWQDDVSVDGLASAMASVLELHQNYEATKQGLIEKQSPKVEYATPETLPLHAGKFQSQIDMEGAVAKSCIHCHQIGDAYRSLELSRTGTLSDSRFFSFPHPKLLGLIMDPDTSSTIKNVEANSAAERSGLKPGDVIRKVNGQIPVSIADIQWVLHHLPNTETNIEFEIERNGQTSQRNMKLVADWKAADTIEWRASTWQLRRFALGGMYLIGGIGESQRESETESTPGQLFVKHVGQYAPHDVAKLAGFLAGDQIVSIDGRSDWHRETDVIRHLLSREPGQVIPIEILRQGTKHKLQLKLPSRQQ